MRGWVFLLLSPNRMKLLLRLVVFFVSVNKLTKDKVLRFKKGIKFNSLD
jgi:hypothetical protein